MNDKVKQTLQNILDQFKTGDIPQAVAVSMFPIPDLPCSKWSLLNRTLVLLSGTMDARGYRQWQHADRFNHFHVERTGTFVARTAVNVIEGHAWHTPPGVLARIGEAEYLFAHRLSEAAENGVKVEI